MREALESKVPLYEAVERACGSLPDGWKIEIHCEQGSGWVELYDDCGVLCDGFPTDNERLDYTVNEKSGELLEGSMTEPVKFAEKWTWARPVNTEAWLLEGVELAD